MIIVGGHSKVALLATPLLAAAGHHVTSMIRNPEHADDVGAAGAVALIDDIEQVRRVRSRPALPGRGRHCLVGRRRWRVARAHLRGRSRRGDQVHGRGRPRGRQAVRHGVVRGLRARRRSADNPFHHYADAKTAADAHLRTTDLNWTILGPGQLTLEPASGMLGAGDHVTSGATSRANVAEVIAAVIGRGDLNGVNLWFRDGDVPISDVLDHASSRPRL